MNDFKIWVTTNKIPAAAGGIFLILFLLLGWLCYSSWSDLSEKLDAYAKTRTELESLYKQKPFPDQGNLLKIQESVNKETASLGSLSKELAKYRIRPVGDLANLVKEKPQDSPQYFQDQLRERVNALKSKSSSNGTKFFPSFYLGMGRYENGLPLPDETISLGRQLTVLDWIAGKIASLKGTELSEFDRATTDGATKQDLPNPTSKKSPAASSKPLQDGMPPELLGTVKITMRTTQAGFREFINELSASPYFLVIDSLFVVNSSQEPPRKDSLPETSPSDATNSVQRLPVIVGRETLNVSLRIRMIDFPKEATK